MAVKTKNVYTNCLTCGCYISIKKANTIGYCSEACSHKYERCPVCGKFVKQEDLYHQSYCGHECTIQYRFLSSFTRQPYIVTVDQIEEKKT